MLTYKLYLLNDFYKRLYRACLFSVCTSDNLVAVNVPSETWEGEGALMRCTTTATTFARVYWYKGNESNVVYVHTTGCKDGTKLHDFSNRIVVGQLVDNGHELYVIKSVLSLLTDEDTYICKIGSAVNSAKLAANGEYLIRIIHY